MQRLGVTLVGALRALAESRHRSALYRARGMCVRSGFTNRAALAQVGRVHSKPTDVDLMNTSAGELGIRDVAPWRDIVAKALGIGLELCPAEVGPQLRLQHWGQPYGKSLLVAMTPMTDLSGGDYVFSVGHDQHGRWLDGGAVDSAEGRSPRHSLVFMRPRS